MKFYFLCGMLACFVFAGKGQSVIIKTVQIDGDYCIVTYDLEDTNPSNNYLIHLYASKDNFTAPLVNVTGDVGLEVKPGLGKKITWNVVKEYGVFNGKLSLEIRGKVYLPFIRFEGITNAKSYRRGKSYEFKWRAGNNNPLSIELYKGGQRISGDINQPNNGSYNLFIPQHSAKGKDYRLKIYDMRAPDEILYTDYFAVKPKIPLLVKLSPIAGFIAVYIIVSAVKNANDGDGVEGIQYPDFPSQQN